LRQETEEKKESS